MVLFDDQGRIKKYDSPNEILEDFYALRLNLYKKRKSFLADRLTEVNTFMPWCVGCAHCHSILRIQLAGVRAARQQGSLHPGHH
jgi:hypothetical protein